MIIELSYSQVKHLTICIPVFYIVVTPISLTLYISSEQLLVSRETQVKNRISKQYITDFAVVQDTIHPPLLGKPLERIFKVSS